LQTAEAGAYLTVMYVCNCNGVRCREVDAAIEAGAARPQAVLAHHGHEPQCCRCLPEIAARIKDYRRKLDECAALVAAE
jgi:bacterioferritin-associated ferredoxin